VSSERLKAYVQAQLPVVDAALGDCLPGDDGMAGRLGEAMRYSVFAGGKRFRPMLVLLACDLFGGNRERAIPAACAIEMIHTYSLIHDDLPAMDDDDFRRGRPSSHKAFDEATAILAGDALLTLAFEAAASPASGDAAAAIVRELARGAGTQGMLGGQMADMVMEQTEPTAEAVDFIHRHKTAALVVAALRLGAVAADASQEDVDRIGRYGEAVGLAFQVADDVLDVQSSSAELGKTVGKDAASGKVTYPAVYGLDEARRRAEQLVDDAIALLEPYGERAELLRDIARYVIERKA